MTYMNAPIRWHLLFISFLACAAPARGQDASCLQREVPVIVQDKNGTPVAGITASDLNGKFRDMPVQILSVTVDDHPRQIVILLDASGSMNDLESGKWQITLRIIADLLASIRQQDSVSLMIFSGDVDEVMGAAQGREAILKRLRELSPGKKSLPKWSRTTAIWDAILKAISSPQPLRSGDVIYLVSDADDNASRKKHSEVRRKLLEHGIRIFSFLLPSGPFARAEDSEDVIGLARKTGGISILISPKEFAFTGPVFTLRKEELLGVERMLAGQINLISRTYLVEIRLPVQVDKFRSWNLSPSRSAGEWRKGATLSYPSELVPCQLCPN